jgi:hypothetical protein
MARPSPKAKADSRKPLQHVSETTEKGGLHRSLGIPLGQKIGAKRIEEATHSKNPKTRKEANLAKTYAKFRP